MADLLVKLYNLPDKSDSDKKMVEQGITIRKAIGPEKHVVVGWVKEHFSNAWASETECAFFRSPRSIYVAIDKEGKMVGFSCYDATAKGFFGPLGVEENARMNGIGRALTLASLYAMREEGYGYAIIGWTGHYEFYGKVCNATIIEDSQPGIYKGYLK